MSEKPFVSIIVPVYNCEPYLNRCLDSIFNQSYKDFEVICIDDGSTDNSSQICKQYDLRYYYQENGGQAVARNRGIDFARGEWICFVDGDDSVEPNYLSSMIEGITDDCGMVVCKIKRINDNGSYSVDVMKHNGHLSVNEALVSVNIGPTNKLIRRNVIGDARFAEGKLRFEDMLFTPEVIVKSNTINTVDSVSYNYYVRENSTMRRFDDSLNDIFVVLDMLRSKSFYSEHKDELDYIVFKNGLFGHLSRIVYLDYSNIKKELRKAEEYTKNAVPDYWNNHWIRKDRQPYFFLGLILFKLGLLHILIFPLKLMEKNVNR